MVEQGEIGPAEVLTVRLTPRGKSVSATDLGRVEIAKELESSADPATRAAKAKKKKRRAEKKAIAVDAPKEQVEALRAWRLAEARKRRVPAFRIMTDRALYGIASEHPTSPTELIAVPGVGPKLAEKYGLEIIALLTPNEP